MSKINSRSISIVGGAGHVGLPLGLSLAQKKFNVNLIDINKNNLEKIRNGQVPHKEINAKKILKKCLKSKKISTSNNLNEIAKSKFVIVCIGTPINKSLKPEIKKFISFIKNLKKRLIKIIS